MATVLEIESRDDKDGRQVAIQHAGTGLLQGIGNVLDIAATNASWEFDFSWSRRKRRDSNSKYVNYKVIDRR